MNEKNTEDDPLKVHITKIKNEEKNEISNEELKPLVVNFEIMEINISDIDLSENEEDNYINIKKNESKTQSKNKSEFKEDINQKKKYRFE